MYYFITASKDATLYNDSYYNTGLDEILEVTKVQKTSYMADISRAILKFDFDVVEGLIESGDIVLDEVRLLLKETESNLVGLDFIIEAYPVSQSWEMGIGTKYGELYSNGVTWFSRDGRNELPWLPSYDEFADGSTGSYYGFGGTFYDYVSGSQPFKYKTVDINMDIYPIVLEWLSGSIPNDGIIVKYPFELEENDITYGNLKFFSKETKTIYQPKIRIGWDDQIFNTGSLAPLGEYDIDVNFMEIKPAYRVNTTPMIRLTGRELYPLKKFDTVFRYKDTRYLPETSYYEVRDYISNDIIIPFGEYSKISCDGRSNFIKLNLTNWETDRTYKICIKVTHNEHDYYFDSYRFKVVK